MTDRPTLLRWVRLGRENGGARWYPDARETVAAIAQRHGCDVDRACDLTALFSPRVRVDRNLQLVESYLGGIPLDKLGCLPSVKESVRVYERGGGIQGPKTSRFARALRGDPHAVVVDTWIIQALDASVPRTLREYLRLAARVQALTYRLRVVSTDTALHSHRNVQACLWVGYQIHHGRSPGTMKG